MICFKNEDDEDSYDNNKYIMPIDEEKNIKIGKLNKNGDDNEKEINNEILNHEIKTGQTNQVIPLIQYKSNLEKQKEDKNENNIINENLLFNDL